MSRPVGTVRPARLAAALAAVAAAVLLAAGPAGAESRYSLRGDGEAVSSARADLRARGGAEIASNVPSIDQNPATLVFADRTTFYGTYDLEWIRTQEHLAAGGGLVRKDYANLVPNLALIFPLPGSLDLGTGLVVQRRRGGTIERTVDVPDGNGGTFSYKQEYEGSGSLLRIPLILAWNGGHVQVGAGADFLLLGSDVTWRNVFSGEGTTLGFVDSEDRVENDLSGVGFRGGVRVPVRDWLALGAYTELPSRLSGNERFSSQQAGDNRERIVGRSADIAPVWGFGADVLARPQLRVAGDWVHEDWSQADPLDPTEHFVNVDRLAIGAEWQPSEGGSVQWPVRVGYRTESLHVLDAFGQKVRQHVLSAGSGFNIAGGRGDIDWYVEFGWRGRKDVTEYLEHFVRFGVTLTGWEKWGRLVRPDQGDDW